MLSHCVFMPIAGCKFFLGLHYKGFDSNSSVMKTSVKYDLNVAYASSFVGSVKHEKKKC